MTNDLFTLVDAESAKAAASARELSDEESQVAYAINYAASCMQTSCIYQSHLSDEMLQKLKAKKYEVVSLDDAVALDNKVYKISWEGENNA